MMHPFDLSVDGKKIGSSYQSAGSQLVAEATRYSRLHLFATPVSEYGLERQLARMDGKKVKMGAFSTLRTYRKSFVEIKLEPDILYDVFATDDYGGEPDEWARVSTHSRHERELPSSPTLEELKLLALEYLNVTPEEATNLDAKLDSLAGFSNRPGIIHGTKFKFEELGQNYVVLIYTTLRMLCLPSKRRLIQHLGMFLDKVNV